MKWKPSKNDENSFLFHLKSSFRSRDIRIFVFTFYTLQKIGRIRNQSKITKFVTSQPGKQTIRKHIITNISRSNDNQPMKFSQSIELNMKSIFLEKACRKWCRKTTSRPLFVFLKDFVLYENKFSAFVNKVQDWRGKGLLLWCSCHMLFTLQKKY